jgi:hypothetical protein
VQEDLDMTTAKEAAKKLIIETGKSLLRDLSKEYVFANGFTDEQVKTTGESRDDIAYSCWSYASIEALGFTPKQARLCIFAALEDLEANYRLKPENLQKYRQQKDRRN